MNILDFPAMKARKEKISMVTCYDYWSAELLEKTDIDMLLVGDSLAMVMHGFPSTVHATIELMEIHSAAVRRGAPKKFVVGDLPFLKARYSQDLVLDNVCRLMQAGCNAIKIEGAEGHLEVIEHVVGSGVPVMGHLGLTPQSVEAFGGHKVQGKTECSAEKIRKSALALEKAGCFALVLECVPQKLADQITKELTIPTIGIGAGPHTDGQVLVLQDLLGMQNNFKPKFLRHYLSGEKLLGDAISTFNEDVKSSAFPSCEESYR
jgi:3-methyl-2-oxobutanoate hydroxymethyltransferase